MMSVPLRLRQIGLAILLSCLLLPATALVTFAEDAPPADISTRFATPITDPEKGQEPGTSPSIESRPSIGIFSLPAPGIAITRTIAPTTVRVGDEVTLSFVITNTGDVPLTNVSVADYVLGTVTACNQAVLPASGETGDSYQCQATMTVTADWIRNGTFTSDWTSIQAMYDGEYVEDSDSSFSVIVETDEVDVITTTANPEDVVAGDPMSFTITVSNTGGAPSPIYGLQDLLPTIGGTPSWTIVQSDFGGLCGITNETDGSYLDCFVDPLAGGESRSITVQHPTSTATCAVFTNLAELYNADQVVHDSASASATVHCPEIAFGLTSDPLAGSELREGDAVVYTLTIENVGGTPLTSVTVDTDIVGLVDGLIDGLGADETITLNATYIVTAGDVAAGSISRSAGVNGEVADGTAVAVNEPVMLTHPVVQDPAVGLELDAAYRAPDGTYQHGAVVFTLTVTNTGDSTLTGLALTDSLAASGVVIAPTLAPDTSTDVDIVYPLTQGDLDAGLVEYEATVSGTPPAGSPVTASARTAIVLDQESAMTVTFVADVSEAVSGDTIIYRADLTNMGSVTLTNLNLESDTTGIVWDEHDLNELAAGLSPGQTRSVTGTYSVTDADVVRGEVSTRVTISGEGHQGEFAIVSEPVWVVIVQPAPDSTPTPAAPATERTPASKSPGPVTALPTTGSGSGTISLLGLGSLLAAVFFAGAALITSRGRDSNR